MRIPVVAQISTKDGVSNKNARLTNCLKESKKSGDNAVVRPGLVLSNTYAGLGNGLIPFDGRLLVIYDDTVTDAEIDTLPWPLDSDPWAAGTTYDFNDTVWYGGVLFFSQVSGNFGNIPGGSNAWGRASTSDTYDPDKSYDIGDSILSNGIRYYSYSNTNVGNTPTSNPNLWQTSAPPATRYHGTGGIGGDASWAGYTDLVGISSATKDAAMSAWNSGFWAVCPKSCPASTDGSWWTAGPFRSGDNISYTEYSKANGRACGDVGNGPYSHIIAMIVQTA